MSLTVDNLKKFASYTAMEQKLGHRDNKFFEIDSGTRDYLNKTYGFHFDDQNNRRSTSNFDRTIATRMFDPLNSSLKGTQSMKWSQSGGFLTPNGGKNITRQYNMALRLIK